MKRIAYTLSLVAATAMAAAPLVAQSSNGPWWDPGRAQTRSGQSGSVYDRNGNVNGQQADGVWRADTRDRNGNTIYVRTRYDSNGSLVREWATRNIIGRYNVIDRQVLDDRNYGNNRDNRDNRDNRSVYDSRGTRDGRGVYDSRGVYDRRSSEAQIKRDEKLRREQIKAQEKYRKEQRKYEKEQIKRQDKLEDRDRKDSKKDGWWKNGKR